MADKARDRNPALRPVAIAAEILLVEDDLRDAELTLQALRECGLGNRATVDVSVEFYGSGRVTRINNVVANQTVRVLESAGA